MSGKPHKFGTHPLKPSPFSIIGRFVTLICIALSVTIPLATAKAAAADKPVAVFKKDARVLFQGDSITDGTRGRSADPNHILGHGYAFIIAAKYGAAYADRDLTFINKGISGNKVTDLAGRWKEDTLALKPDVLSILIGINDVGHVSLEDFESVYDQLLIETRAANPEIRLVLCEPFILPMGSPKEGWGEKIEDLRKRREVVKELAKKHHAAFVPFQKAFDDACKRAPAEHWIWDGIHPTYSGHQIMADEWVRTVREFWPHK